MEDPKDCLLNKLLVVDPLSSNFLICFITALSSVKESDRMGVFNFIRISISSRMQRVYDLIS